MPDIDDVETKFSFNKQTRDELASYVERVYNLDKEVIDLRGDRKSVLDEAKSRGFDPKAIVVLVKRRFETEAQRDGRESFESIVELYDEVISLSADEYEEVLARRAQKKRDRTRDETGQDDIEDAIKRSDAAKPIHAHDLSRAGLPAVIDGEATEVHAQPEPPAQIEAPRKRLPKPAPALPAPVA